MYPDESTPKRKRAEAEMLEAKHVVARAKALAGVSAGEIATVLDCSTRCAGHIMNPSQMNDHLRLADLLRLSKDPGMRRFVTEILGSVQANFDQRHLRVCDLEAMGGNTATAELARSALRTVVSQLWPEIEQLTTTAEPEGP